MKNSILILIGYGEGIRQQEDVDFFDEHPDFIRMSGFGEG